MGEKLIVELPIYIKGLAIKIQDDDEGVLEFAKLLADNSPMSLDDILNLVEQGDPWKSDNKLNFVFVLPYEMESTLIDLGLKRREDYNIR